MKNATEPVEGTFQDLKVFKAEIWGGSETPTHITLLACLHVTNLI